jgi:hypothetical protein
MKHACRVFSRLVLVAGALTLTTAPAASASSLFVDATVYGVKCDGSADDTTAINNAISAAPNGSIVTLPASSSPCITSGAIFLPNTKRVNLLGGGTQLQYSGSGNAIGILDMELGNVNPAPWVKGISITCTNSSNGYGIHIRNSLNILIEDVQIHGCRTGIYLHNTNAITGGGYTEQTVLRSVDIYNCGYGIYLDPDTGAASFANTTFENVRVDTMANSSLSTPYGIYVAAGAAPYRSSYLAVLVIPDKNGAVGLYTAGDMSGDFGNINFEVPNPTVINATGIVFQSGFKTAGLTIQSHFAGFGSNGNQQVNALGGTQIPSGWILISGF